MTSICTVLTGTKYDVNVVNKLYISLKKHITKDFKFYCYTDHTGFNDNINIIPITTKNKKLQCYGLFKLHFAQVSRQMVHFPS